MSLEVIVRSVRVFTSSNAISLLGRLPSSERPGLLNSIVA